MKKTALYILTAAMILSAFSGCAKDVFQGTVPTPEPQEKTAAAEAETPSPAATEDIIAEATADELRVMIEQYRTGGSYEMMYAAALRLIELEPSDTGAYTAAMDALIAMMEIDCQEVNGLLAKGLENAEDAGALAGWAEDNQPGLSIEIPFISDYESEDEINTAGTTAGNLVNDVYRFYDFWETGLLAFQGDWLYFSRPDEGFAIYKMRLDGSDYQRVGEACGSCLNVVGDWLYFRKMEGDSALLCKMRTDGSKLTTIAEGTCRYLSVSGDWAYYGDENDNYRLFSVPTDGGEVTALTETDAVFSCVYGDWVYYSSGDGNGFYRTGTGGNDTQKLSESFIDLYGMSGDWIYYVKGKNVWRMRLDGSGNEEVMQYEEIIATMNIAGDRLLLSVNNDGSGGKIIAVDMASFEILNTFEQTTDAIYADGKGNAYFVDYNDLAWYRIDTDTGRLYALPLGSLDAGR